MSKSNVLDTFGYVWIRLDTFTYVWTRLDTFGHRNFGYFWTRLDTFGYAPYFRYASIWCRRNARESKRIQTNPKSKSRTACKRNARESKRIQNVLDTYCRVPRVFSARVRSYRAFGTPECAVTARFWHPHARLPRALAPDNTIALRFERPRARLPRFWETRVRGHRAFLAPTCAL